MVTRLWRCTSSVVTSGTAGEGLSDQPFQLVASILSVTGSAAAPTVPVPPEPSQAPRPATRTRRHTRGATQAVVRLGGVMFITLRRVGRQFGSSAPCSQPQARLISSAVDRGPGTKTGRAQCRARGCAYVEISGGAVT